jgi:hypothetical protein
MTTEQAAKTTFARAGAGPIERAAQEFKRALTEGDSAFTPGKAIWTGDHASELIENFVGAPDISGSSFDDKLTKQLANVTPGATQLFAELYCLDLLPLADYKGATKRACISVPLALGGVEVALPQVLNEALDHGVLNGGVAFKTRRFWQLCYLVEFAAGFLALSSEERQGLLDDPLAFRERLDEFTTTNAPSQRSTLLYLLFPDFFLPIAKSEHKSQIRAAFEEVLGQGPGDIDADLHAIYLRLVDSAGKQVDLYQAPYRQRWDPKALSSTTYKPDPWSRLMGWAARMAAAYDLDKEERSYKLEMARRLVAVRPEVLAGSDGWVTSLRSALNYGNLLDRFFKTDLFNAFEQEPSRVRDAIIHFWRDDPDPQLMSALHAELKQVVEKTATPGNATALGSVLLMARDSAQYPPYRPTPVEKARALTAQPSSGTAPAERYDDLLSMCDEVLDRAADHGLELQDRLDAQGLIWAVVTYAVPETWSREDQASFAAWRGGAVGDEAASTVKRAWLVRGSSVNGRDLVPVWLDRGSVSLAASKLRPVDPDIGRDELKPIVDEDYAHTSYAQKAEKLDEFHVFLSRMQPGDLVATTTRGSLHIGRVEGPAMYVESSDERSNLRRAVQWVTDRGGVDYADVPPDLAARLQVPRDLLDLTQQMGSLEALLEAEPTPAPSSPPAKVVLRSADEPLAEALHVPRGWLQECIDLLNDRPQLIFYGPPGTGKTYIAQHLAEHVAGENVRLVQFHPAYSYEDFFEGFRPVASGGFELRPGPMRRVVDAAVENPTVPHVLIIDEINRGNLAKVFGELYFLLEYRNRNVDLLYASDDDKGFTLPSNVFIIGTMNTADRSIALVDAAMRRRFAFLPLHPADPPTSGVLRSWLAARELPPGAADLLDELNRRIDDSDFQIGPSYFMRDAVHEPGGLDRVWRTAILPLLEEHHYGEMSRDEIAKRYGLEAVAARVDSAKAPEDLEAAPEPDGDDVGEDSAPDPY